MSIFSDLNEVQILGNVTAKPDIKVTQNGVSVTTINVATSRQYKQGEEWKTEAEFIPVVLWGKLAEHAGERLEKGTRVLIKGRIKTRSWEDDKKEKHYKTEVIANDMILIARYNQREKKEATEYDEPAPTEADIKGDNTINPDDLPF